MALTTLGATPHFVVMYDPAAFPNSQKRAQVLLDTVEGEYSLLCAWFGVTDGFGASNPIHTKVASKAGYGGQNGGYESRAAMWINLDAQENVAADDDAAERIKAIFVAEFVEILMSYLSVRDHKTTWNYRASNGEGLSHFCSVLRFPQGYYSYGLASVNAWLQRPDRENQNFVLQTEPTDVNIVSYGCATLFLFYLRSQLGFTETQLIQSGGSTLESTYGTLTGNTNGFGAFTQALRPYFPLGNTPPIATENPFPLHAATFDASVVADGFETDGCKLRFHVVGDTPQLTVVIVNIQSIYAATNIRFQWEPFADGQILTAADQEAVTIRLDAAGVINVTVTVTISTATEVVSRQVGIQLVVIDSTEAGLWRGLCHYWQMTRFIPRPIPVGDPAAYRIYDYQLLELENVLGQHVRQATEVRALVKRVIQERAAR